MNSNEEPRERVGVLGALGATSSCITRLGVVVAAILIALLYARSCWQVPSAEIVAKPVAIAAVSPPTISNVDVSGSTANISGTGEVGQTVELFINDSRVSQIPVDANGRWRYTASNLADGDYQAVASHQEGAADRSERVSFMIGEPEPTIVLEKPEWPDWRLASNSATADSDLILTGTGTPNVQHVLFVNGVETQTARSDDSGKWLFVLPAVAEGDYEFRVVALGNGDDTLASDNLNLAIRPPEPVAVATPEATPEPTPEPTAEPEPEAENPDYFVTITDFATGENSDTPVTISGEGSPGHTVGVYIDGVLVSTQVIGDDGTWSFTGILSAGSHSVEASLFDNENGDVSSEPVSGAGTISPDVAAARTAGTDNPGENGLFRVLFNSQAAAADNADDGDGAGGDDFLAGAPAVELIIDASWSMTFPLDSDAEADRLTADDPASRIAIAQASMVNLIENTLPEGAPVAVRAFGNVEGDLACRTDLMAPLQPMDRENLAAVVNGIDPQFRANTAIAAALEQVSSDLAETDREKIVVLLTDGQETCGGDPAAVIQQLAAEGTQVSLNIIGFAILDDALKAQFAQWAELGNGQFYDASDADLLNAALEGAMTVGYTVESADSAVTTGVVGGSFLDLAPGVYTIKNSAGDVVYENVVITPGSVLALPGG